MQKYEHAAVCVGEAAEVKLIQPLQRTDTRDELCVSSIKEKKEKINSNSMFKRCCRDKGESISNTQHGTW